MIEAYPEFTELYREVFDFRYHKKELVSMYSEALRILDQNTVELMVELQQEEIKALREENLRLQKLLDQKNNERRLRVRYSSPRISHGTSAK